MSNAQWKKYTGNDKQIAEINNSETFLLRRKDGATSFILSPPFQPSEMDNETTDSYLICQPHPYADMICQWARTGQPVYVKVVGHLPAGALKIDDIMTCFVNVDAEKTISTWVTNDPNWCIPGAEYRLTPFGEGV